MKVQSLQRSQLEPIFNYTYTKEDWDFFISAVSDLFHFIVPFSIYMSIVNICLFFFLESLKCAFPKRRRIKGSDQLSFTIVNVGKSFPGGRRKWCKMKRKLVH